MSPSREELQGLNLRFFRDTILDPLREFIPVGMITPDLIQVSSSLALVEATLWLRLGAAIGFFSFSEATQEVERIASELSRAWLILLNSALVSPNDSWCEFMTSEAEPKFVSEKFLQGPPDFGYSRPENESAESLIRLSDCFLGCILLAGEMLVDPSTLFFQGTIGRGSEEELIQMLDGTAPPGSFSINDLYLGLGRHVTYFRELMLHLENSLMRWNEVDAPSEQSVLFFGTNAVSIASRRQDFGIGAHFRQRCLTIGGRLAATVEPSSPQGQELRRSIFFAISEGFALGSDPQEDWRTFLASVEKESVAKHRRRLWHEDSAFATE